MINWSLGCLHTSNFQCCSYHVHKVVHFDLCWPQLTFHLHQKTIVFLPTTEVYLHTNMKFINALLQQFSIFYLVGKPHLPSSTSLSFPPQFHLTTPLPPFPASPRANSKSRRVYPSRSTLTCIQADFQINLHYLWLRCRYTQNVTSPRPPRYR